MFNSHRAMRLREEAAKATEHVAVLEEDFILMLVKDGKTEDEARMQAKVARFLGSEVLIGGKMVGIKKEEIK